MAAGFLIVNRSTVAELTGDILARTVADLRLWLDRDFCPEYGRLSVPIDLGASEDPDHRHSSLLVDFCDDPDAVAYHTRDAQGRPCVQVGLRTAMAQGGAWLDEIGKALSHEFAETIENEYVNLAVQLPDGRWQMREVSDPVQGGSYLVGATMCSAFVTRAYWDPDARGVPFAVGSTLPGPLTIAPHGYRAFADGGDEFGSRVSAEKIAAIRAHGRVARFRRTA